MKPSDKYKCCLIIDHNIKEDKTQIFPVDENTKIQVGLFEDGSLNKLRNYLRVKIKEKRGYGKKDEADYLKSLKNCLTNPKRFDKRKIQQFFFSMNKEKGDSDIKKAINEQLMHGILFVNQTKLGSEKDEVLFLGFHALKKDKCQSRSSDEKKFNYIMYEFLWNLHDTLLKVYPPKNARNQLKMHERYGLSEEELPNFNGEVVDYVLQDLPEINLKTWISTNYACGSIKHNMSSDSQPTMNMTTGKVSAWRDLKFDHEIGVWTEVSENNHENDEEQDDEEKNTYGKDLPKKLYHPDLLPRLSKLYANCEYVDNRCFLLPSRGSLSTFTDVMFPIYKQYLAFIDESKDVNEFKPKILIFNSRQDTSPMEELDLERYQPISLASQNCQTSNPIEQYYEKINTQSFQIFKIYLILRYQVRSIEDRMLYELLTDVLRNF